MNKIVVLSLLLHLNSMLFSVQPVQEHKNIPSVKKSYFHKHKKLLCTGITIGMGLMVTLVTVRFGMLYGIKKNFLKSDVENNELTNVIKEIVPAIVSAEIQEVQYTHKNTVIYQQPALFITITDEKNVSYLGFLLELREKIKELPYMQQHWPDLNKICIRGSARKWADKNDYFIGAG